MNNGYRLFSFFAVLLVIGGLSLSPAPVRADAIIDFGIVAPTVGTISFAGGAAPLIGTGIDVDNVVGLGTPLNDGVTRPLSGFFLNFTSGNFVSFTSSEWVFGSGGTISISDGTTDLLTGTFSNAIVTYIGGTFKVSVAALIDNKDPALTAFYGLPSTGYVGGLNLSFMAVGVPPNAFTSTTILSGDVANSISVPEPGILILLGIALSVVGLATWRLKL